MNLQLKRDGAQRIHILWDKKRNVLTPTSRNIIQLEPQETTETPWVRTHGAYSGTRESQMAPHNVHLGRLQLWHIIYRKGACKTPTSMHKTRVKIKWGLGRHAVLWNHTQVGLHKTHLWIIHPRIYQASVTHRPTHGAKEAPTFTASMDQATIWIQNTVDRRQRQISRTESQQKQESATVSRHAPVLCASSGLSTACSSGSNIRKHITGHSEDNASSRPSFWLL